MGINLRLMWIVLLNAAAEYGAECAALVPTFHNFLPESLECQSDVLHIVMPNIPLYSAFLIHEDRYCLIFEGNQQMINIRGIFWKYKWQITCREGGVMVIRRRWHDWCIQLTEWRSSRWLQYLAINSSVVNHTWCKGNAVTAALRGIKST